MVANSRPFYPPTARMEIGELEFKLDVMTERAILLRRAIDNLVSKLDKGKLSLEEVEIILRNAVRNDENIHL